MITRIVKMTFLKGKEKNFLEIFRENENTIRNFEGCSHLELWNDINEPAVFFTYSLWESEDHLKNYRDSELFRSVWEKTSALFSEKAEARSLTKQ